MVFYRKYRPQKIADLDLESVREKLYKILSSENLPHAFLFTGTKGLGKTSSARILAKTINCEGRQLTSDNLPLTKKSQKLTSIKSELIVNGQMSNIEPCNSCSVCISITEGSNIDVIEIDAASNRGIDEIRDLRERVKFAPASLKKKVYIIDEVHMLTTEAFNALLKTLEEPPEHVVFILCTTEVWKLPSTIISRTFHLQFEKPSGGQIARSLLRIVQGEKLDIEDGVLERVAEFSDGAFRDAAKILEELAFAAQGEKITLAHLEKAYKSDSIDLQVKSLLIGLAEKNAQTCLKTLDVLAESGCDFKIVTEKLVENLRQLLLKKNGLESQVEDVKTFDISSLQKLLEYFNQAYKDIRFSVVPQLPLELAVVKYCIVGSQTSAISNFDFPVSNMEKKSSSSDPSADGERLLPTQIPVNNNVTIQPFNNLPHEEFLKRLIDGIKPVNFSIAGVLRSTKISKMDDTQIEITTPFKFHAERLRDKSALEIIQTQAKSLLGKDISITITIAG